MATLTAVGGIDMSLVLAGGGVAVVTAETGAGGRAVVEVHRGPVRAHMATVALRRGADVSRRLAHSGRVVMTTGAGANHCRMVDGERRRPG